MQGETQPSTAQKIARLRLSTLFWDLSAEALEPLARGLVHTALPPGAALDSDHLWLVIGGTAVRTYTQPWARQSHLLRIGGVVGAAQLAAAWQQTHDRGGKRSWPIQEEWVRTHALTRVSALHIQLGALTGLSFPETKGSGVIQRLLEHAAVEQVAPEVVRALAQTPQLADIREPLLFELLAGARVVIRHADGGPPSETRTRPRGPGLLADDLVPDRYFHVLEGALGRELDPRDEIPSPGLDMYFRPGSFVGLEQVLCRRVIIGSLRAVERSRLVELQAAAVRRLLETEGDFRTGVRSNVQLPLRRPDPFLAQQGPAPTRLALLFPHPGTHLGEGPSERIQRFQRLTNRLGDRIHRHLEDAVLVLHLQASGTVASGDKSPAAWARSVARRQKNPDSLTIEEVPLGFPELRAFLEALQGYKQAWDTILIDVAELAESPLRLAEWLRPAKARRRCPVGMFAVVSDDPRQRVPAAFFAFETGGPDAQPVEVVTLALVREELPPAGPLRALTRAWKAGGSVLQRAARTCSAGLRSSLANTRALVRHAERGAQHRWGSLRWGLDTRPTWPLGTARLPVRGDALHWLDPRRAREDSGEAALSPLQPGLDRWARAVTRRRVGLALGGGGATGYEHIVLIRRLYEVQVPVDILAGTSAGSLLGSYFARFGQEGLDLALEHWWLPFLFLPLGIVDNRVLEFIIGADLGFAQLTELDLPFLPTATNIDTGKEWNFRRGLTASTARASGSLPPLAPALIAGSAYLDGAFVANVPTRVLDDEGASVSVASNVMFPVKGIRPWAVYGLPGLGPALRQWNPWLRGRDVIRGQQLLLRTSGQREAHVPNVVLYEAGFAPYGGASWEARHRIIEAAERSPELQRAVSKAQTLWLLNLGSRTHLFQIAPADPGDSILAFPHPFRFEPGQVELEPSSHDLLGGLANRLRAEPEELSRVAIWARASRSALRRQRAQAVRNQLQDLGVPAEQLEVPADPVPGYVRQAFSTRASELLFSRRGGAVTLVETQLSFLFAPHTAELDASSELGLRSLAEFLNRHGDEFTRVDIWAFSTGGSQLVRRRAQCAHDRLVRFGVPSWRLGLPEPPVPSAVARAFRQSSARPTSLVFQTHGRGYTSLESTAAVLQAQRLALVAGDALENEPFALARQLALEAAWSAWRASRVPDISAQTRRGLRYAASRVLSRALRQRGRIRGSWQGVRQPVLCAQPTLAWHPSGLFVGLGPLVGAPGLAVVPVSGQGEMGHCWQPLVEGGLPGECVGWSWLGRGAWLALVIREVPANGSEVVTTHLLTWGPPPLACCWRSQPSAALRLRRPVLAPDGDRLLVQDGPDLVLLSLRRPGERTPLELPPGTTVQEAAWNHDGSLLAARIARPAAEEQPDTVWAWTPGAGAGAPRGQELFGRSAGRSGPASALAWHPGEDRLAVALGAELWIVAWGDPTPRKTSVPLGEHHSVLTALAWRGDGGALATASLDGSCRIYRERAGRLALWTVLRGHRGAVGGLEWHPAGEQLLSRSDDGRALVWDTERGELLANLLSGKEPVAAATWRPGDGRFVATLSGAFPRIWAPLFWDRIAFPARNTTALCLGNDPASPERPPHLFTVNGGRVQHHGYDPDSREYRTTPLPAGRAERRAGSRDRLAFAEPTVAAALGERLLLWTLGPAHHVGVEPQVSQPLERTLPGEVQALELSPDGRLAACLVKGELRVVDTRDRSADPWVVAAEGIAWAPAARESALLATHDQGEVRLWCWAGSGTPALRQRAQTGGSVHAFAWSRGGPPYLAVLGDDTLVLYDERLTRLADCDAATGGTCLAWSDDARYLAWSNGPEVQVRQVRATGGHALVDPSSQIIVQAPVLYLAWHGDLLLTFASDGQGALRDLTGEVVLEQDLEVSRPLADNFAGVGVRAQPEGNWLVTLTEPGTIHVDPSSFLRLLESVGEAARNTNTTRIAPPTLWEKYMGHEEPYRASWPRPQLLREIRQASQRRSAKQKEARPGRER